MTWVMLDENFIQMKLSIFFYFFFLFFFVTDMFCVKMIKNTFNDAILIKPGMCIAI